MVLGGLFDCRHKQVHIVRGPLLVSGTGLSSSNLLHMKFPSSSVFGPFQSIMIMNVVTLPVVFTLAYVLGSVQQSKTLENFIFVVSSQAPKIWATASGFCAFGLNCACACPTHVHIFRVFSWEGLVFIAWGGSGALTCTCLPDDCVYPTHISFVFCEGCCLLMDATFCCILLWSEL